MIKKKKQKRKTSERCGQEDLTEARHFIIVLVVRILKGQEYTTLHWATLNPVLNLKKLMAFNVFCKYGRFSNPCF